MEAFVDKEFYTNTYLGKFDGTDDEFKQLVARSMEVINALTSHKIPLGGGIDAQIPFVQDQVKLATCSQIEHYIINGGFENVTSNDGEPTNVTLGKFTYGIGGTGRRSSDSNEDESQISRMVQSHLAPTGLLYRGVGRS